MNPVLKASLNDVRHFSALLRGVNFINRATVTVTERGMTVIVEEARTLLGTAFIFADIFDEYEYHPELPQEAHASQKSQELENEDEGNNAAFEIPLNTFIECLNIFGTAGGGSAPNASEGKFKRWKDSDEKSDDDSDGGGKGKKVAKRGIDQFFGGKSEQRTGMRMSYAGAGYPLTVLLAEDADGPTTTCEISTFEPEPHLELPFNSEFVVLKIILKSSWLREALSELDPSCSTLTFIGNPPKGGPGQQKQKSRHGAQPMLRIQATGTCGSAEMDYPDDRDVLETFECKKPVNFSYRFGHIARTLRALQSSTKTSLRIDEEGLLSLQFLMPSPISRPRVAEGAPAFVEFRCLALDEPE
ncbi:Rad1/Rec1/Rad17 [Mycena floridula]|nr:Rad1/Rec1/Rad17 [Mycena floridula]